MEQANRLIADKQFMRLLKEVYGEFKQFMEQAGPPKGPGIAYFCMDYGLHQSNRRYSGVLCVWVGGNWDEGRDSKFYCVEVGCLVLFLSPMGERCCCCILLWWWCGVFKGGGGMGGSSCGERGGRQSGNCSRAPILSRLGRLRLPLENLDAAVAIPCQHDVVLRDGRQRSTLVHLWSTENEGSRRRRERGGQGAARSEGL